MDPTIKLSGTNAARASNDILTSSLDQNPYVSYRLLLFNLGCYFTNQKLLK